MLRYKYNFNVQSWSAEADTFTRELATKLNLEISIRENPTILSEMIIVVEGEKEFLDSYERIYIRKLSKKVSIENFEKTIMNSIELKKSRELDRDYNDIKDRTICKDCIAECLKNQFYLTSCAKCEPRYSITTSLPFKRENTVFDGLSECEICYEKYYNPEHRSYKTESIYCDVHNSLLKLFVNGKDISNATTMKTIIKLLKAGKVGLLKNINGFYIIGVATKSSTIEKIREITKESRKALPILFKTALQANKFVTLSKKEELLLTSDVKPTIRVKKREIHRLENVKYRILNSVSYYNFYEVKLPKNAFETLLLHTLNISLIFQKVNIRDIDEKMVNFQAELNFELGDIDDSFMQVVYGKNQILKAGYALAPTVTTLPKTLDKKVIAKSGDSFAIGYEDKMILAPSGESIDRFLKLYNMENSHMIKDENRPYLPILNIFESSYKKALIIENDKVYIYDKNFQEIYSFKKSISELFDEIAIMSNEISKKTYEKESQLICESSYEICKEDHFSYIIQDGVIDIEVDSTIACENLGSALINTISNIFIQIIKENEQDVILCGDLFENKNLTENIIEYLDESDRSYFMSQTLPIGQSSKPLGMILDFYLNM